MNNDLGNSEEEAKRLWPRYRVLYVGLFLALALIFGRLWYLQIVSGAELRRFSERNRIKETKMPAPRGLMLDRHGKVIVENLPSFEVTLTPQYSSRLEETADAISPVVGIESEKIIREVKRSRRRDGPFRQVRIQDNLSLDQVYQLKLIRWTHPGLNINETVVRHYPLGPSGAQMFGYVDEISKSQIKKFNDKYPGQSFEQGDIVGKSGLEELFEEKIRGEAGVSYLEVDAKGREAQTDFPSFLGLKAEEPQVGRNLVLTIDRDLQAASYKAMFREDKVGNRVGGVVVLKSNGEILSWVSTPSFEPDKFSTGISNDLWRKLMNDPDKPLRNKVIQDHYPPGSTFKPVVALAALEEKIITPWTSVFSPGFLQFGRRKYHDARRGGHGNINVRQALERSSNVFFYKMGIQLGIDKIAAYAKAVGMGQRTGLGIRHESAGLVPTSAWKLKAKGEEWQPGENLSNAIGQGYMLSTILQMALVFNTIATEGLLFKPQLVKRVIDQDNRVIEKFEEELVWDTKAQGESPALISAETYKTVKEGLRLVAMGDAGTARWYRPKNLEMAAKTGTVQVRRWDEVEIYKKCQERRKSFRHHGWMVAFAPVKKPEIAVAVFTEHSCGGSSGSGPVVKDVMKAYFEKYHPEDFPKDSPPKKIAEPKKIESNEDQAQIESPTSPHLISRVDP